jgi:non-ribosomal peptide synthase protein (TIGR01720 family)
MIHKYSYESDIGISVPIGIPSDNVQIYILDKDLTPVTMNTVGEMYISGDGVARGYLNRPDLTREKFVENPFINGRRMYKTGDLARFLSNGKIEYAGRADQQVKIRGYRIELGEIEKYLLNHQSIKNAIVIAIDNEQNNKFLCAYIVKKVEVPIYELKSFLLRNLPDYMVPTFFIELDEMPINANGKVNREMLPKPEIDRIESLEFVEYRNEKEKALINAICNVLNIERVGTKQNFFYLGGDSIKAIQVAAKLNDQGFKIKVKDILSNPIVEEMALYVEQNKGVDINQGPCEGSIKPTPIMSWYFAQNFSNPNHYNQSVLLELKQNIDFDNIEMVFNKLIRHHDALRINYNMQIGELFYSSEYLNKHFNIDKYDLSAYTYDEQRSQISSIGEKIKSSFNIEKGLLIKACIFIIGENRKYLLLTAHHLVVDGVSWSIIAEDIYTMLKQMNANQKINLPLKTHSLQSWTELINIKKTRDCTNLYDDNCSSKFTDQFTKEDIYEKSNKIEREISSKITNDLLSIANKANKTNTLDLIIVALTLAVKDILCLRKFSVDLEGHGRDDIFDSIDVTRTVGWFTRIYPLYLDIIDYDYSSIIKFVRERLRKTLNDCNDSGEHHDNKNLSKTSIIKLNYLGDFSSILSNDIFEYSNYFSGNDFSTKNHMSNPIEIDILVASGVLRIHLTYSRNIFKDGTIESLLDKFIRHLTYMIEYFDGAERVDFIPSDFDTVDISQEDLDSLFI